VKFTANPKDIFLWPDGYWCFRNEFGLQSRQTYEYLVARCMSDEWNTCIRHSRTLPSGAHPDEPGSVPPGIVEANRAKLH
jgi:hypothetical protein